MCNSAIYFGCLGRNAKLIDYVSRTFLTFAIFLTES